MNQSSIGGPEGGAGILAKANQIRSRAERMLREATALDELKRLLGSTRTRRATVRGR